MDQLDDQSFEVEDVEVFVSRAVEVGRALRFGVVWNGDAKNTIPIKQWRHDVRHANTPKPQDPDRSEQIPTPRGNTNALRTGAGSEEL